MGQSLIPNGRALGIACGIGAGALWGLVFLLPALVHDFTPVQITIGRFLCFGLIAVTLLARRWRTLFGKVPRSAWWTLMWLSITGNTLYFILVSAAVQTGGIAMTSLVVGFLPVTITLMGGRDKDSPGIVKLLPSLLFCVLGAVFIGWDSLSGEKQTQQATFGLACAVGALVSWSIYAIRNARALRSLPDIDAHDWNLLLGLVTGAQGLLLLPIAALLPSPPHELESWIRFAVLCMGVAIIASIAGNAMWNRMSQLLPLTLVGQMILFETVFALIYAWLWEWRPPTVMEIAALFAVCLSVITCLAAHRAPTLKSTE